MYYLTYKINPKTKPNRNQPTLTDIVRDFNKINQLPQAFYPAIPDYKTFTREIEEYSPELARVYVTDHIRNRLSQLWETNAHLLVDDMSIHYHTFLTPKKSGGMRQIMAPNPELKSVLREFKDILQNELHVLCHDASFAYATGRSTKHALQRHQTNQSKWFLKMDLKDFFPSCNYDMVLGIMKKTFPVCDLFHDAVTTNALCNLTALCFVDDKLPQGTPTSPFLTNLVMLPVDLALTRSLSKLDNRFYVYTRYADDLLISSPYTFDWRVIQDHIKATMDAFYPGRLKVNGEKTRYGNASGRNWNLGLMLNKENNITIGHKRKQELKAMLHNFMKDFINGNPWSKENTQIFLGQLSYARLIEPDYFGHIIDRHNEMFIVKFDAMAKQILRNL